MLADPYTDATYQVYAMQTCVDILNAAAWLWAFPLGTQQRKKSSGVLSAELLGTISLLLEHLDPTHPHPLAPAVHPHAQRMIDACLRALVALTLSLPPCTVEWDWGWGLPVFIKMLKPETVTVCMHNRLLWRALCCDITEAVVPRR